MLVGRHHVSEFDDTPGEHCGGECHRKAELDVVAGVVVAAGEVDVVGPAVAETRIGAPLHSLVLRQESGALPLEEEDCLGQCLLVIVSSDGERGEKEKKKKKWEKVGKCHCWVRWLVNRGKWVLFIMQRW